MKPTEPHNSMRGYFAHYLYEYMYEHENVYVITGDLGYKMFDDIRDDYPDRFINVGASEQAMLGIACGLAMSGKIPVVYSITPFLIFRGLETIRNYINAEKLNVKLIGSGRNRDYEHDGISHWAEDVPEILEVFPNINVHFPDEKEEIENLLTQIIGSSQPEFVSLTR